MKILSKSLILFSIVTLGFTACSENEQLADDSLSKVPVLLTTRLAAMDADATRAGVSLNESRLEKGNVGVWLSSVGYDTKYTYTAASGGALSSESPAYYPTSGTTDIVAVYPASAITADASQATAFAVLADQTLDANYEASDLMSGKLTEKSKTSGVQSIPLAHKMAKVIVNITPGAGVSSITSVTLNNIKRQITYTASTDVLGQAEQILGTDVSVGTNNCAAVIPPQTIAASTDFLTIVTDAGTAVYQFKTAKELLTGNCYQLNITVNRTATQATNTIADWDGSGSANVAATTTAGELELSDIDALTYTGSALTPTPEVRFGETVLESGTEYELVYTNNINVGNATVTAVGKGTYAGKVGFKEFAIDKATPVPTYNYDNILIRCVGLTSTFTITYDGDGEVTAESNDETVATVTGPTNVSEGHATFTITNVAPGSTTIDINITETANWNAYNGDDDVSVTCELIINPSLGDKYYSDGTWGNNYHGNGAQVIGIVAWLGNDSDLKCGKSHGLVMAAKDVSSQQAWGGKNTDENFLTNVNNADLCFTTNKNGLTNTTNLINDAHTHNAASAARNYTPAAPSSSGNTSWFLPSVAQWMAVMGSSGVGRYNGSFKWDGYATSSSSVNTNINNALSATGLSGTTLVNSDAYYWCSNEASSIDGVYVYFNGNDGVYLRSHDKSNNHRVRAFLAF